MVVDLAARVATNLLLKGVSTALIPKPQDDIGMRSGKPNHKFF
jgi:hypothetical protein